MFSRGLGAEASIFPLALAGTISLSELLAGLILEMAMGVALSLAILLIGWKVATFVAMDTLTLAYGAIAVGLGLAVEVCEWAW
jgi:hypothetical protein